MKQIDLAQRLTVARTTISNYELGVHSMDPDVIFRLCEIFGCTSDYLLGFSSVRSSLISEEDAALVAAYHAAPESVRQGIDALLAPYMGEAGSNTAVS
ncbi:MAG: helix-turn-helix transcriptional regulator [Clostridia bacterium]|nr:helix-turn-helix transcriptional regulator [Clostridia bacterium]